MTKTPIRFKTKLLRPANSEKGDSWTFLILPKNASAKLPSRGMTVIEGTINGVPFQTVLEPDGQKRSDITPVARRDWIHWTTSAKQPERARAGSKMPARCSPPKSDALAASTTRDSTVKA